VGQETAPQQGGNMKTVLILKDYKEYKKGEIVRVNPNEAHTLIDCGCAKLYENKMMTSRRSKC